MSFRRPTNRALLVLGMAIALAGCRSDDYLSVRKIPRNPLEGPLQLLSWKGPRPTERTQTLLRRYAISKDARINDETIAKLQMEVDREPTPEKVYAMSEVAYIAGKKLEAMGRHKDAFNRFSLSVANSYRYLFDPQFDLGRNPYDPQFRRSCDVYNSALEAALRIVNTEGGFSPGTSYDLHIGEQAYRLDVVLRGPWHNEDIDHFEFANDYEIEGLANRHQTYGLGVPLIAVRKPHPQVDPAEHYYPKGLSFPITAFLRVSNHESNGEAACVLELYDPLSSTTAHVAGRRIPLETDISTPLGYFLDHPDLKSQRESIATLGLLRVESVAKAQGLYMLEPYDPTKIPVLMVHGLWSSPITWMEMFNDLRSFPELRERYQFWFYLYPTGQPFWSSAAKLRQDLAQMRQTLDPQRRNMMLDQLVLVGHSMGGLVSRLQTIESGDDYWRIVSDHPFEDLDVSPEVREQLAQQLFFSPNPSVKRVITIGTPHRGSDFANDYTRWLARKLISLPGMLMEVTQELASRNPDFLRDADLITTTTSIDSLSPGSPIFSVLDRSPTAPWLKHHNIVGVVAQDKLLGRISGHGDGVVGFESAHMDKADSELVVEADHTSVHRHPRAILEVRRVLRNHLREFEIAQRQFQQYAPHPQQNYAQPASAIER